MYRKINNSIKNFIKKVEEWVDRDYHWHSNILTSSMASRKLDIHTLIGSIT